MCRGTGAGAAGAEVRQRCGRRCRGGADMEVQWCQHAVEVLLRFSRGAEVQRWSRGGAEVLEVEHWSRGGADAEVVQRCWCRGAGAEVLRC